MENAFIRALAHREQTEIGAAVIAHGSTTEIRYPTPIDWPWPRQFSYTREFFSTGAAAESLAALRAAVVAEQEHVVNLFSSNLGPEAAMFAQAGYTQAWVSTLLGRTLARCRPESLPAGVQVHEVVSPQDMIRYASLRGISNPGTVRDPSIHNFYANSGNEVVAKGQLVYVSGTGAAYVSDMFTAPQHRRKGLCGAIMSALEAKAIALGATCACLAPGLEVASFGLYEKYGYAPVASRSVLIPKW